MNPTPRDGVDELLQTYSETGGINYLDVAATLPSRSAIDSGAPGRVPFGIGFGLPAAC